MRTTSSLASHDLWCLEAPIAWCSWCTKWHTVRARTVLKYIQILNNCDLVQVEIWQPRRTHCTVTCSITNESCHAQQTLFYTHCRVLPPGEFNGTNPELLPMYSESFMAIVVTIYKHYNKCVNKTHIRQTWRGTVTTTCNTPVRLSRATSPSLIISLYLPYSKLLKLTAASNAGGVERNCNRWLLAITCVVAWHCHRLAYHKQDTDLLMCGLLRISGSCL